MTATSQGGRGIRQRHANKIPAKSATMRRLSPVLYLQALPNVRGPNYKKKSVDLSNSIPFLSSSIPRLSVNPSADLLPLFFFFFLVLPRIQIHPSGGGREAAGGKEGAAAAKKERRKQRSTFSHANSFFRPRLG